MGHVCSCDRPGNCPWHQTITTEEQWLACRDGTPPVPAPVCPCVYLGERRKRQRRRIHQTVYECKLFGDCTLEPNGGKLSDCADCSRYLTVDAPNIAQRWIDPLRVLDCDGKPTIALRNLLRGGSAFLVCGGPSYKSMDYERLAERGIFSLGVNNAAGHAPVSAFTCSDPPSKFHNGIFTDPKIIKLIPTPKLRDSRNEIREKKANGFEKAPYRTKDCPNMWAYDRRSWLACDDTWFTETSAAWGNQNDGIKKLGLDPDEKTACTMLLGLRLLQYLGARRIFLLGVDFYMDPTVGPKDNYAFGEVRDASAVRSNNRHYRVVNGWLVKLRPVFERYGFRTYNCNPHSGLRAFDYVPFDTALEVCRGKTPKEPFDLEGWYEK